MDTIPAGTRLRITSDTTVTIGKVVDVYSVHDAPEGAAVSGIVGRSESPLMGVVEDVYRSWDGRMRVRLVAPGSPNDKRHTWIPVAAIAD